MTEMEGEQERRNEKKSVIKKKLLPFINAYTPRTAEDTERNAQEQQEAQKEGATHIVQILNKIMQKGHLSDSLYDLEDVTVRSKIYFPASTREEGSNLPQVEAQIIPVPADVDKLVSILKDKDANGGVVPDYATEAGLDRTMVFVDNVRSSKDLLDLKHLMDREYRAIPNADKNSKIRVAGEDIFLSDELNKRALFHLGEVADSVHTYDAFEKFRDQVAAFGFFATKNRSLVETKTKGLMDPIRREANKLVIDTFTRLKDEGKVTESIDEALAKIKAASLTDIDAQVAIADDRETLNELRHSIKSSRVLTNKERAELRKAVLRAKDQNSAE